MSEFEVKARGPVKRRMGGKKKKSEERNSRGKR
jgi:hypothetical protein